MIAEDTILLRRDDLAVEAFDDALLLWDQAGRKLHHLDSMAAIVWQELDGRPLAVIASALAAEFGAPVAAVRADLVTLGERLIAEGLAAQGLQ